MATDLTKYAFSFSHAIIKVNDVQITGISAVELSQDIDREATYGTGRQPQKRAAGLLSLGDGLITFSDLEDWMKFYDSLGDDPSLALFSLDVTLDNRAGDVRSFECLSCAVAGVRAAFEQGATALSLEQPFDFMKLKVNGREFAR